MGFPDSSDGKESTCNAGDPGSVPGLGRSSGEGIGYPVCLGFPCSSTSKESTCNEGDLGLIPGLGRSQYSGLENSMDYSPWGHKESDTTERLSLSLHGIVLFKVLNLHITKYKRRKKFHLL